jgi:hypothetical protein
MILENPGVRSTRGAEMSLLSLGTKFEVEALREELRCSANVFDEQASLNHYPLHELALTLTQSRSC